jgi:uncharacterized membrane protein HdeD (DUF308 family)
MVTVERQAQPDIEKRTRLLAAVLCVLGGLAILAPLMSGANAESRVGFLLVIAAVIELYHGFRRSSEEGRKAAWQSGAVTVLMGILVLNSDTLIFSAFLLFLGGWFAFDAVRYIVRGFGNKASPRGALVTWALPALGNAAVAVFILFQYQKAPSWIVCVAGALRILGTAWNVLAAAVWATILVWSRSASRSRRKKTPAGTWTPVGSPGSSRRYSQFTSPGWAWIARSSAYFHRPSLFWAIS